LPTLSKGLDNAETLNGASESATFDEAETVKQWLERVEQPDFSRHEEKSTLDLTPQPPSLQGKGENSKPSQEQERGLERGFPDPVKSQVEQQQCQKAIAPTLIEQSSESVVDRAEVGVNANSNETDPDEETDPAAQQEEYTTAFSDEEFKTERMMWLLNRIYTAEQEIQETPISAEEFWKGYKEGQRDFTGANLAKVNLSGNSLIYGVNLNQANLTEANLSRANLNQANLSGANLRGANISEAELTNAKLDGANLDKADLHGARFYQTNLSKSNLRKANLSSSNFALANLSEANLSRANLSGAILSEETNFSGANFSSSNLSGANLRTAKLNGVDLSNANLSNANLLQANLEGANLQEANLQHALYNTATIFPNGFDPLKAGACLIAPDSSLQNANFACTDLRNADLSEANLSQANLTDANLESAKLLLANLSEANLSQANLSYANLTAANLSSANLINANLQRTNLTTANLSKANLKNATLDNRTNLSSANLTEINLVGGDHELLRPAVALVGVSHASTPLVASCFRMK
jgi:uncharacterized protein YjbI with pentapeptide repeats